MTAAEARFTIPAPDELEVGAPDDPEVRMREHLWLADRLARRAARGGGDPDDLHQVAMIGLWNASRRFDPDQGTPFLAFAHRTIAGELKRYRRDTNWLIRLPRSVHDGFFRLSALMEPLTQELGRSPTIAELAEGSGMATEMVVLALEAAQQSHARSIEATRDAIGDSDASLGVRDRSIEAIHNRGHLASLLRVLNARERTIVTLRFFHDLTQREIATRIGFSQMQVSRILARALDKLRIAAAAS